ncbi:hypothetical protein [Paracoccus sp. S4493]|uniref:hypothetical protein n=1 Tax=Paracoccus sp. S4493 TaxID=579490 RepID=UPI000AAB7F11|nr:hypothetical protein [Paracoccus sp. S4493]
MPITEYQFIEADSDYYAISLNFTGGIKAWKLDHNEWSLGPIEYFGAPTIIASLSDSELRSAISHLGISPVQYENTNVSGGIATTFLRSASAGQSDVSIGPADVWHNISKNIGRDRIRRYRCERTEANFSEIKKEKPKTTFDERYADYISDSLRSMDICVGAICSYYHQALIAAIRSKQQPGTGVATTADLPFIANVHSFFIHVGAARDYLALLIARRLNLRDKINGMNRLVEDLDWDSVSIDPLILKLVSEGCLARKDGSTKCKVSGWLEQVSNLRNTLVHKRPYGSHADEQLGRIEKVEGLNGHFVYIKPIVMGDANIKDTLDVVADTYAKMGRLFLDLAGVSGGDTSIPVLTDGQISEVNAGGGE